MLSRSLVFLHPDPCGHDSEVVMAVTFTHSFIHSSQCFLEPHASPWACEDGGKVTAGSGGDGSCPSVQTGADTHPESRAPAGAQGLLCPCIFPSFSLLPSPLFPDTVLGAGDARKPPL